MQKRKIIENDDEFKWTTKRFATQKRSETENGRDGWDFITRNRRSNFPAALSAKSLTFSPSQNFLFLMLFGVTDPPNDPTNERLSYQREDKYLFLFVCTLVVEHHNRPFNKCIKFNSGSQTVCLPIYLSTFDLWKKLFDFNMMDEPCCWAKVVIEFLQWFHLLACVVNIIQIMSLSLDFSFLDTNDSLLIFGAQSASIWTVELFKG